MAISLLDGIVLVVMLVSAILAMIRGLVREVLSIGSWIAAALATAYLYEPILPFVKSYVAHDMAAVGITIIGIFVVTLIIVSFITIKISDFVLDSKIGALDRTLGFVFGALRGVVLIAILMIFFNWFVPEDRQPGWVVTAKTKPLLNTVGERLVTALPESLAELIRGRLNPPGEQADNRSNNTSLTRPEASYTSADQNQLNQIVQSTTNNGRSN